MTRSASPPLETDYWQVLALSPGADAASLKRAFRQQARRWHPDLNGNDPVAEERFKLVNEAYAVLGDPKRRAAWEAGLDPLAARNAATDPFAAGFPAFEDYLDALFGRRRRSEETADSEPFAGESDDGSGDGSADSFGGGFEDGLGDDFRDDPGGASGPTSDSQWQPDPPSGGVTHAPPSPPPVQAAADLETMVELTPEQALEGTRLELELPGGTAVECWTPPMAGDGWRLRLAGVASGGGDHFLQLRVRTADGLRVEGLRVSFQLELSPPEAALGCLVVVPTLQGRVQLRVPPGSSSGRLLRLRGRGLARGEQRGDQLVEVRIMVPEQLNEAEEALYRRLEQLAMQSREELGGGDR
ncbi:MULTISPECIES: DnaJ C-terminal domain-containing protein [unclassified Synechococcus]|uniref:DnaJ C-terminal domain-containing protein n=1 Tax=unclassified Synechococcus TaxID=2626047 RepID=UPI0008FF3F16|nr:MULTISPECIES: DnaJ C-terminal domain-containing protein [unclassified Synechococcus]APD48923.1 molecular chaperone DnaJ [Synechococcus sp. SynAce01]MCT0246404.1 DnaJ domain-containing protein [Synechococcus sp. CS-601]TWB93334.1 DnaJ-like protein [Synechococcus sp. Ace-Pa]